MKRPLAMISIFFIAGIFAARECGSYLISFAPVLPILLILVLLKKRNLIGSLFVILACAVYLAGAFAFSYSDNAVKTKLEESAGKPHLFSGYICSDPEIKKYSTGYEFRVTSYTENNYTDEASFKAILWIPNDNVSDGYKYGDCLEVRGAPEIPNGVRNPGGFDYRSYLAGKGISALIYAESCRATGENKGSPVIEFGRHARDGIIEVIDKLLPQQQAALLNGMLIGYRESLSEEVGDAFRDAGLSHIMAVSGANLVFLIMPLLFLMRHLGAGRLLSNVTVMICMAVFVLITGFEPSVVRAAVMALIVLMGDILRREPDILTSIAAAAVCLLAFDPHSLFNIGFQLSFIATLSLVLITPGLKKIFKRIKFTGAISTLLAATIAAQIGTVPVVAYYFNTVSLISLITNLIVVPLTGIITVLGMAMALLGQFFMAGARILAYVNCSLLSLVLYITGLSTKIRFASIVTATPNLPFLAAWYLSLLIFAGKISYRRKFASI
ncbi:MAG: ComEC/Rec2 family competence protein, partial [Eubacteriales bacterium]|nr:ComEC/Rec2 family competence protein [Eubacteriales bacterium]